MSQSVPIRVSIAMATYNGAAYLQEQLDSFVAQTRLPDELVITDDCSTDETSAIVERFAENAPFEVLWEKNEKNLGYAGNFNKALMQTTGDLVFLSDQDDVWFPEKIEHMLALAEQHPEALVLMNDAAYTDRELRDLGLTKLGQLRSGGFSKDSFVMGCCAAIKREMLDICLPIPAEFPAHDSWIVPMAIGMGRRVVFPEVMQWYRRHESNESQGVFNRRSRLTRWETLKFRLYHHIREKDGDAKDGGAKLAITNTELLLSGIRAGSLKAPEPYRSELSFFARELENQQKLYLMRIEIRRKMRLLRVVPVVRFAVQGGYRRFSGIESAARDLFFR